MCACAAPGGGALEAAASAPAFVPADALLASGEALVDQVLQQEEVAVDAAARRVELGFPAGRLADIADEEAAELIVVGSRGRGAFKAAFLGSVSADVIGVARCSVLVVPPAAAAGRAGLQ